MLNPDLEPFLDRWEAEWATLKPGATPTDRRAHFEFVATNMRLATPADIETDAEHWVDTPAGPVRARVFRHEAGGIQDALIYLHGGAWMQGSPETHWDITSRLASWNRQTVLSVDYALAPERPFPAAFDQVVAVARWAHENAGSLGIAPDRITIGGDSAGGNLAAAAALALRGDLPLLGQLLVYPACDFRPDWPSMIENAEAPLLQTSGMDRVNAMYSPDTTLLATDPRVAPLVADSHEGLPPAFVAVAENDPLRDSGTAYAKVLEAVGVPVEFDAGEGLIHGYLRAMDYCPASMDRLRRMADWLARL